MTKKSSGFEKKLGRLEEIVQELESESADLENSVKLFEEGVELSKSLSASLKEIKFKVEVLKKDAEGKLYSEPLENDEA